MSKAAPFLEQTWRWFGPFDPVPLAHIRQAGATGVVTALHHIPNGAVWTVDEIQARKNEIEKSGLTWSVVESVPIHEDIKQAKGNRAAYLANYAQTLRNLAACGLRIVCYNFMPLLDWTRTHLAWTLPDGSEALRFDAVDSAIFDLHILKRFGAEVEYSADMRATAAERFAALSELELARIERTVLLGLPGTVDDMSIEDFRKNLSEYSSIDSSKLRRNLAAFLRHVIPVADEVGVSLCIHPDDPPFSLFGLPRIASTEADLLAILDADDCPANGITFCSGSLGAHPENDLPTIFRKIGPRVHFVHLRNVQREPDGSFFEADHLDGSTDMAAVMLAITEELDNRAGAGRSTVLPMRPDHGHRMLGDLNHVFYPGYSPIGRLRGLAELRGLERGIRHVQQVQKNKST